MQESKVNMPYYSKKEFGISKDFQFPAGFETEIRQHPLPDYYPWFYLCKFPEDISYWITQAKEQYPDRNIIPFAKYEPTDDVVCFDGDDQSGDPKVHIVHFFASAGWEDFGSYDNFEAWLESAKQDSAEYMRLEAENES